ncbi:phage portal protein [Endozoicomonas sp. ISHI1]|uniref:phage portal protein n=1 Tax=Endozoicomonas sp. ISHI1 TaxID=2825882 RepID=UPI0021495940|nr:phage portal protein [Endozoicomonas sp. ISHI1]
MLDLLYEQRADPLENPANSMNDVELLDYIRSHSGIAVSEEKAMELAAVYSCLYVLSSSLAQLPLVPMRRQGKTIKIAMDHATYDLLCNSPNAWQSSYDWRESGQCHAAGWGNAFTCIERNRKGEILELYPALPWSTSLLKNGNRYVYSCFDVDRGMEAIQPEDMIHIRSLGSTSIDWRMGKSPIRQHAETIGLGLAAQKYGSKFFASGGRATGLVTPKSSLSKENWGLLKQAWKSAKATFRDDGGEILLPSELEYQAMTIPPEEAQFIDSRKMTRSEVAGIFNVPSHMINDLEKATFSNISEQAIQFVRHTMMPWVVKWEQELNRKLFSAAERKAGYYVKFNLAGLLRGTAKDRAEFYSKAINDGWMDRNEVRTLEDLNPRDGLDELLVSVNAVPLSQFGEDDKTQETPDE